MAGLSSKYESDSYVVLKFVTTTNLSVVAREPAVGRVIFARAAVRVAKVPALVAQRVHAALLVYVQPA